MRFAFFFFNYFQGHYNDFILIETVYPKMTGLSSRLKILAPFLFCAFVLGACVAIYDSHPRYILAIAVTFILGIYIIGPFSTGLQSWINPLTKLSCKIPFIICLSSIILSSYAIAYFIFFDETQIFLSTASFVIGSILGHDATIAITESEATLGIDKKMIAIFPVSIVTFLIAGYSSLGFFSGVYQFAKSLLN